MIHVYAVIDRTEMDLACQGLEAAPVEILAAADLGVAVTTHATSDLPPSTEAIVAHAGVCDALLDAGCTVLPVRFGARYASPEDVEASVTERADAFRAALERVRGRVEVGVRVASAEGVENDVPVAAPAPATGTDYLRRRLDEEHQREARRAAAEEIADAIDGRLRPYTVDAELKVLATPGLLLSAAYLVESAAVEELTAAVAELSGAHPDLQLLCTGPWPPYHFVGEGALA